MWWAIAAAFSVVLNFICRFITWHPPPPLFFYLSLSASLFTFLSVSLNLEECVGCVSSSNLSVYCVGKGPERQLVNSRYRVERLGRMLCVCVRVRECVRMLEKCQFFSPKPTLCVCFTHIVDDSIRLQKLCYILIEISPCCVDFSLF